MMYIRGNNEIDKRIKLATLIPVVWLTNLCYILLRRQTSSRFPNSNFTDCFQS